MSNSRLDIGHLRQVALSIPEMRTISFLAKNAGDVEWHPENVKPITNQMVAVLEHKGLVEIINRGHELRPLLRLRLTDQGRKVAAQLEAMDVAPKVEAIVA